MNYTVALVGEYSVEHYYSDVELLQTSDTSEDYILWGKGDKILAIYPRKEVRYIQATND